MVGAGVWLSEWSRIRGLSWSHGQETSHSSEPGVRNQEVRGRQGLGLVQSKPRAGQIGLAQVWV